MDLASLRGKGRIPFAAQWTDETFKLLLELYSQKASYETLAVHFGKTRGQISGMIDRAAKKGLVKRHNIRQNQHTSPLLVKPRSQVLACNEATVVKRVITAKKKRRVRLRLITDENQVTFAELEPHHCRWPIGDPRQSDFRYCGCRRELKKPYCETHSQMAGRLYEHR